MNSQHFSHINVWCTYKCMGSKFDLAVKKGQLSTQDHHFSNFGRFPVPEDLCKDKAPGLIWLWSRRFLKVFTIYGHGLGRAAVCDCGTPWTFLLTFMAAILVNGPRPF